MTVALVHDPIYLEHETGAHVENSGRLVAIIDQLQESQVLDKLLQLPPRAASLEELALVHSDEHISRIQSLSARGGGWLDLDTCACPESFRVALFAAGGALRAVDSLMTGETNRAFAVVRPPGHHATPDRAMGFCLFNNIAIAARYAMKHHGVERILIADFDVHHGNGTEEAFYSDPGVLYFSTHQSPHYPGTGAIGDTGSGDGKGANVNVPLPAYCGDLEHLRAYREILAPLARRFKPQLVLTSAGYDNHWADPLSSMQLTVDGFAQIVTVIKELADELCEGRLLLSLEGGYHPKALSMSVQATFEVLLEVPRGADPLGKPLGPNMQVNIDHVLDQVSARHGLK